MATANPANNVFEFRGVEDLYFAEVLTDTDESFECGTPKRLSYTATIAKEVETSSETHFYDNAGMIVINAKGAETYTLTVAPPPLGILAEITGQAFDAQTGMMIEGVVKPKMFAIGYKTKGTDGYWRFVWKLKGQFAIPSEEVNTESNSIDTTNTELTFTAISTIHKFSYTDVLGDGAISAACTGIVLDERYGKMTDALKDGWTSIVQTPETVYEAITGSTSG